jgi:hypothetical protein
MDDAPGVVGTALGKCVGLSFYTQGRFITCVGLFDPVMTSGHVSGGPSVLRIPPYEYVMHRGAMRGYFVEKHLDTVAPRVTQGTWHAVRVARASVPSEV